MKHWDLTAVKTEYFHASGFLALPELLEEVAAWVRAGQVSVDGIIVRDYFTDDKHEKDNYYWGAEILHSSTTVEPYPEKPAQTLDEFTNQELLFELLDRQ